MKDAFVGSATPQMYRTQSFVIAGQTYTSNVLYLGGDSFLGVVCASTCLLGDTMRLKKKKFFSF